MRLNVLLGLKETVPPDSLSLVTLQVAEHYLFEMDEPLLALEQYEILAAEETAETLASKALLAIAWVREYVNEDSVGAADAYDRLVELHPETEYADLAREKLGLPPREIPEPVETLEIEGPHLPAPEDTLYEETSGDAPVDSLLHPLPSPGPVPDSLEIRGLPEESVTDTVTTPPQLLPPEGE